MKHQKKFRFISLIYISISHLHFISTSCIASNGTLSTEVSCPVNNENCYCSGRPFYSIHCKNISNLDILDEIAENMTERTIILELESLNFTTLPLQILENNFLISMVVKKSSFHELFNYSMINERNCSSNLRHLSLENVSTAEWSWSQLSILKNLDVFFAYDTTIGQNLTVSFSQHMSKALKLFSISGSNISSIEQDTFKDMPELNYIRISHSKLRTLSRNILPIDSKLEQLKLDHNEITSLPNGMFQNMFNLEVVSLSNNRISALPEEVFRPLWRPNVHLELRSNPIKCDCHMQWIVTSPNKPEIIGTCAKPKALHGRNIADISEADLQC